MIVFIVLMAVAIAAVAFTLRFLANTSPLTLQRAAIFAAIYVPLMGAMSIYYSMFGFNYWAVFVGVSLFITQWIFVVRSNLFQRRWSLRSFKIAFIINSLLRLPISYFDPMIFMGIIFVYETLGYTILDRDAYGPGFFLTLFLTLTHGIAIQLIYAVCLAIIYAITRYFIRSDHA